MINKSIHVCNNCGKYGHLFHQCKLPITSYGIILFRLHPGSQGWQYLMIRRKDSFGYIDFMRGKYSLTQKEHLQKSVDEMSVEEKIRIQNHSFDILWKWLWLENMSTQYRNEEIASAKKFELIKNGIFIHDEWVDLKTLLEKSSTQWQETEWEFPKGRRNTNEKDIDCALREFEEETGIPVSCIKMVENVMPYEELFIGSNHKSYKHKYFLAYMSESFEDDEPISLAKYQRTEVSKVEWKTLSQCIESIRPYHLEKVNILMKINKMLEEYKLFSV